MSVIAPNPTDPLNEIIGLLGMEPNIDSLADNSTGCASPSSSFNTNNLDTTLNHNLQIRLTLNNRYIPNSDDKTDLHNLYIK